MAGKGGISGTAVFTTLAGAILAYSGLKGKRISTTVRDLLAGKNPQDAKQVELPASLTGLLTGPASGGGGPVPPNTTPHSQRAKTNEAIAKPLAAALGWTDKNGEWPALVTLWNNESGWDNTAYNSSSGATGIPQAVPPTKLPPLGQAPYFDARAQIVWGLSYIKVRYGKPSKALAFWMRTDPRPYPGHWY